MDGWCPFIRSFISPYCYGQKNGSLKAANCAAGREPPNYLEPKNGSFKNGGWPSGIAVAAKRMLSIQDRH
jgi:hypothetical protein